MLERFTRAQTSAHVRPHVDFAAHRALRHARRPEERPDRELEREARADQGAQEGHAYVMLEVCTPATFCVRAQLTTSLSGTISFRNPYGYRPAIFFGFRRSRACARKAR